MRKSISMLAVLLLMAGVSYAAKPKGVVFDSPGRPNIESPIDKIVFPRLRQLEIPQSQLCSDAVFIRRVYLDVTGTLPTFKEARDFIEDRDQRNKRRLLIDRLLQRPEFADYWAMKWSDVLRIKAEFPVNLWPNAAQAYHRWVRAALATNMPYDQFARELLTSSGSNFRVGAVNFYRAIQVRSPDGIATAVALAFMGTRAEAWPAERRENMAQLFSQVGYKPTAEWKEEIVFWDPFQLTKVAGNIAPGKAALVTTKAAPPAAAAPPAKDAKDKPAAKPEPKPGQPLVAIFPDGKQVTIPPDRDPRDFFADWLIRPDNPWFAKACVNRIWGWLLGRGIVHEPDDIRDDNEPVHPGLLEVLEKELVASKWDTKAVYRMILNSQTYQASSVLRLKNPKAEQYFGVYIVRRLDAEVLIDAIDKITGTTDLYTSAIPEPFTYIPAEMPAVAIADGSITSPFLALFGRSARATGFFDERPTKPLPLQWLHMLNSSHIQNKLEQGTWMKTLIGDGNKPLDEILNELYLTILSRFPTQDEVASIYEYLPRVAPPDQPSPGAAPAGKPAPKPAAKPGRPQQTAAQRRENAIDVAWALINSIEFMYRH